MITNERQYRITKSVFEKLQETIRTLEPAQAAKNTSEELLRQAQFDALESERQILADQLAEYESLKSGSIADFTAGSLHELPDLLVKARIAKGMSQRQLAVDIGVKEQQIQRYEAERYRSASLHRLLEIADALGLQITKHAHLQPVEREAREGPSKFSWARFPINEMYRRGWFPGFSGNEEEAESNAVTLLEEFLTVAEGRTVSAFHRKHVRSGSWLDEYSLFAWECRVLWLARSVMLNTQFARSQLTTEWIHRLVKLSAAADGPAKAKEYLREAGIVLVVEPHLSKTYLDGAALLLAENAPVIAMTLRYDRLDTFWFVLLHELAHLLLHFRGDDFQPFFDDLDAKADPIESEADQFASDALIPADIWETAVARYLRTTSSIQALAHQLAISPALVAGKIRREANNYVILNDLIGLGEVRRQFPEVSFGK